MRGLVRSDESKSQYQLLQQLLLDNFDIEINQSDSSKINVAIVARDGTTSPKSSAFIRLIAPLTSPLAKEKLTISIFPENTVELALGTNICIVQRTAYDSEKSARQLLKNLNDRGIKLVIDTDDAFHLINPSHPEYKEQFVRVTALALLLENADEVWLSVPKLAKGLPKLKHSPEVIRNTLDRRLWSESLKLAASDAKSGRPLSMLYMGTVTHDADLDMIMPSLAKLAKDRPGSFKLTVVGVSKDLPNEAWIERLRQGSGSIYPNFVKWYLQQGPFDIGLSPLVDNEFNQAKSDIKCLDYIAAGMVPVVSDIEPYQFEEITPHIIGVKNTDDAWYKQLRSLVDNPDKFRRSNIRANEKAQRYLWSKRTTDETAEIQVRLLTDLVKNT